MAQNKPEQITWLSPEDLAAMFNVPLKTIYAWNHRQVGPPAYRIGRHCRYRIDEVLEWATSQAGPRTAS